MGKLERSSPWPAWLPTFWPATGQEQSGD